MEIFNISDISEIKKDNVRRVAALGFFDGIHNAHQKIICGAVGAAIGDYKSIVITLDKSPKEYFGKTSEELLTPINKKNELLESLGVDEVYYLEFNEKLQNLSAEDFIEFILKELNVDKVFCGFDYRFGNKGLGTPDLISENGIDINVQEEQMIAGEKISTTVLKKFVRDGEFQKYREYSGRYYSISGLVVKGRQLGRTINFPTANLQLSEKYLLPEINGVYITKIKVHGEIYKSITNIGYNPTVSSGKNKKFIETHILDFDEDIYDEKIAEPIGEVYYYLDNDIHSMGIVIQGKYRGKGYSYSALIELEKVAFEKNNISELSDIIPLDRIGAIKTFKKAGFKHTEFEQKKLVFGKESIARQLLIVKDDYFNNKINADNIIIRNEDRSE